MVVRSRMRHSGDADAPARAQIGFPPSEKSLPFLLLVARDVVLHRFRHLGQAHAISDPQWRVVRALAEVDSLEIGALAARCHIHSASLSRMLPKLAKKGLIARCPHTADHRRVIVSLAPGGRRLVDAVRPEIGKVYAQIAREFGQERLDSVYALLEELISRLEATSPAESEPRRASGRMREAV